MVERAYPKRDGGTFETRRRAFWRRDDEESQPYTYGRPEQAPYAPRPNYNAIRSGETELHRPSIEPKYIPRQIIPRPNSPANRMGSLNGDYWYTPLDELARIELIIPGFWDPCPIAAEFDGLEVEWPERCFINPPFSKIQSFIQKGCAEWNPEKTFIWLVNADFKTEVGIALAKIARSIALTKTPIHFRPGNSALLKSDNKFGSAYILWSGDDQITEAFRQILSTDCIVLNTQMETVP
jgi:hypothetical protein